MDTDKIIEVISLEKDFNGFKAVKNLSFSVRRGEIFAFLGPNGAGKTTTIRMLTTLLKPTSGSITVAGFDAVKDPDEVRTALGIVFQDPSLDEELTAWENLEFHGVLYGVPKQIRRERIEQMLKFVDLWERRKDLVKTFSGGMKRRLEIARGLVHHPKILFLDEPTLGLDPQTRKHIWDYIKKLNNEEKMTIFFSTHYMDEAERSADRIAVIDHGEIISQGSPKELMERSEKTTLEDAFLDITGHGIRDGEASSSEKIKNHHHHWK